jgi:hypothetical protein
MFEGGDPEGSAGKDDEGRGRDLRTVELTSRGSEGSPVKQTRVK